MKRPAAALAVVAACVAERREAGIVLDVANRASYEEARIEGRLLERFVRDHPGIRVRQQRRGARGGGGGGGDYHGWILTAMAAGTPPDAVLLDAGGVAEFARKELVLDLAPYLPRLGVDLTRYHPIVLESFRRGRAVYVLPTGYTPIVIVYNKDVFDRAGVPYPAEDWTWDDFFRIARQLTRDTDGDGLVDQWGTAFDRRVALWLPWIWSGGGDVLCPDGRRASGCLDSPRTLNALRWYTGWLASGIAPRPYAPRRAGDNLRLFDAGRVGMLTGGHFWVPHFLPYVRNGRLRIGFAMMPHRAGAEPATVLYGSGYAVPALAPHRRLSVELATALADSSAQARRAAGGLALPSLVSLAESLAVRDSLGWAPVFVRAAAHGRVPWAARVDAWPDIEPLLDDMMDRITLAGADPVVAARATAARLDRLLAPAATP